MKASQWSSVGVAGVLVGAGEVQQVDGALDVLGHDATSWVLALLVVALFLGRGPQGGARAAAGGPAGTRSALAAAWGGPPWGDQPGPPPAGTGRWSLGQRRGCAPVAAAGSDRWGWRGACLGGVVVAGRGGAAERKTPARRGAGTIKRSVPAPVLALCSAALPRDARPAPPRPAVHLLRARVVRGAPTRPGAPAARPRRQGR